MDAAAINPASWGEGAWGTLMLFLIPVGGGIPAGVLLARKYGLGWPAMEALYFISDVILAFLFEPVMKGLISIGRRVPAFGKVTAAMKAMVKKTTEGYGTASGPLALILIAFAVDPMTGRASAHAAGHGFVSGWALAITGDQLYFTVLMVSTLWLNAAVGDATTTIGLMMLAMLFAPSLIKSLRKKWEDSKAGSRSRPPEKARPPESLLQ